MLLQIAATVVGGFFATSFVLYRFFPETLIKIVMRVTCFSAGMSYKTIRAKDTTYSYISGGNRKGPSVLLLHGFNANKEQPLRLATKLAKTHHVFILDQAGHGDTVPRHLKKIYTPAFYAECVHDFAHAAILPVTPARKFHILGESLGGLVSGLYAATYPEDIISATLLCPAGIVPPTPTPFQRDLHTMESRRVLVPSNTKEMLNLLKLASFTPIKIPPHFAEFLGRKSAKNLEWFDKLFTDLRTVENPLGNVLSTIKVPLLVIWGDKDELLHVSTTEVFKQKVPKSVRMEVHILPDCGHVIDREQPEKTAALFLKFTEGK